MAPQHLNNCPHFSVGNCNAKPILAFLCDNIHISSKFLYLTTSHYFFQHYNRKFQQKICIASPEKRKNISKYDKRNKGHTYLINQTFLMKLKTVRSF